MQMSYSVLLFFSPVLGQVRAGVGEAENRVKAAKTASFLLSRGAEVGALCRWTQMTPLHLAAFFDSDAVMQVLLEVRGRFFQVRESLGR